MSDDVEVRQAHPDEWETYRQVRLSALADAPDAFASTLERELALGEPDWRGRLTGAPCFLAWRDGLPLGTITLLPCNPDNDYGAPGASHIVAMWVDPIARGQGVADRLVDAAISQARQDEARAVALWVFDANERARAFYLKMGFRPTDVTMFQPHRPEDREQLMIRELA